MRARDSRTALLLVAGALLILLAVVDLMRSDSLLRSLWPGGDDRTPAERMIREVLPEGRRRP